MRPLGIPSAIRHSAASIIRASCLALAALAVPPAAHDAPVAGVAGYEYSTGAGGQITRGVLAAGVLGLGGEVKADGRVAVIHGAGAKAGLGVGAGAGLGLQAGGKGAGGSVTGGLGTDIRVKVGH
ncbi:MAG: hypothetical protein HZC42_09420 [Candidatus Eisenbacteria bacterium]|nr:hypothetical protein [Candidatus Eisenbacteria bacterium]